MPTQLTLKSRTVTSVGQVSFTNTIYWLKVTNKDAEPVRINTDKSLEPGESAEYRGFENCSIVPDLTIIARQGSSKINLVLEYLESNEGYNPSR